MTLSNLIKAQALGLGFDLAGIATLGPVESAGNFDDWLAHGYAGEMTYLERGAEKRRDTRLPFAGATSAVVVALNYDGTSPAGPVARYARGDDYHDVMLEKLDSLHEWIEGHLERAIRGKSYVDTGPILERDLARKAGLGWIGKNTNLINPEIGSFFFIGALLVDLELEPDDPFEADRCGTCTRCLEVCPTHAIVEPHVLDATRCISYLTIESRSGIPLELRESIGTLLYGCDICQDVCPWNVRFSRELSEPALAPRGTIAQRTPRDLAREVLSMDEAAFRETFRNSAMKRAKRTGLARSAAVVLGNIGNPEDTELLEATREDQDPIVREHAQWALSRIYRFVALIFCIVVTAATPHRALAQSSGDVHFLQGMIVHHQQALDMSALIPTRTNRPDMKLLGERITVSQTDEIKTMQRWLASHHQSGTMAMRMTMPGMLSADQMKKLAAARGKEFDSLFLTGMIAHHKGALKMVADLFSTPGAGQAADIFALASDIDTDQREEIDRMRAVLASTPNFRSESRGERRELPEHATLAPQPLNALRKLVFDEGREARNQTSTLTPRFSCCEIAFNGRKGG